MLEATLSCARAHALNWNMPRNLIIAEQLKKLGLAPSAPHQSKSKPKQKATTQSAKKSRPKAKPSSNQKVFYTAKPPFAHKKQAILDSIRKDDLDNLPAGFIDSLINAKSIAAIAEARKHLRPLSKSYPERPEYQGVKKNAYKIIYIRKSN